MWGNFDFSLGHKVKDDVGGVAPGIIDVKD
jgi:hypothetical protein